MISVLINAREPSMDVIFKPDRTKIKADETWKPSAMTLVSIFLLLLLSLIPGCTTRIVSRPADNSIPATGIAYYLPATELSYVMTFRLVNCRGAVEIIDTAIEQRVVPDRGTGAYLIDSSHFSNLSKTIPLARISISNGLLTSISYDAKDNTAEIIKGGATLVSDVITGVSSLNVSSLLGGAMTMLASSRSLKQDQLVRSFQLNQSAQKGEAPDQGICNQATEDVISEYGVLQQHLKTVKNKLYKAEGQLAETGNNAADRISAMEDIIRKTKERIAELDRHLTLQYRKPLIVESGKCDSFGDITLDGAPFTKWFGDKGNNDRFRKQFQAWIEDNKLSYTISKCNVPVKGPEKTEKAEGLYYRIPAECRLEITRDTLVSANPVELMQCGRLAAVEITNGAFQNNSHRLEFDPVSGEIKSFEFRDNAARASEAISGASDAVKAAK
jgi:hypothetical protein